MTDAAPRSDPSDQAATARPVRVGVLVGSVGEAGGGVAASVRDMALALDGRADVALTVLAPSGSPTEDARRNWGPVALDLFPILGPSTFGFARGLDRALQSAKLDLLHVHGLWMYMSIAARRWAVRTGRPYLVSPHGMLDPWALANSGWKKAVALRAYERSHLDGAACIHALCEDERLAIRAFGLRNRVTIIPNGVAIPTASRSGPRAGPRRTLLFLGRLTPKKGLLALIEAWATTRGCPGSADWSLEIAGIGPADFVAALEALIARLEVGSSVRLVGHQADEAKARTFRSADAFILPSISEGQPLAVLEAWAYGLPVLITRQCNLPEGAAADAAMMIGVSTGEIASGLVDLFALSDAERLAMGLRGRSLAESGFSWRAAARLWAEVYRTVAFAPPSERPLESRRRWTRPKKEPRDEASNRAFDQPN